jgi:hypothetical protein
MDVRQAKRLFLEEWGTHAQLGPVGIGKLPEGVDCISAIWYPGPDTLPGVCGGYAIRVTPQEDYPQVYTAG